VNYIKHLKNITPILPNLFQEIEKISYSLHDPRTTLIQSQTRHDKKLQINIAYDYRHKNNQ
jgi:hypothetical protein